MNEVLMRGLVKLNEIQLYPDGACICERVSWKKEVPLDIVISNVDRTVDLNHRDNTSILLPDLQLIGPREYNLRSVGLYLHDKQREYGDHIQGTALYKHLQDTDSLKYCLGIHDARKISEIRIRDFREHFGNMIVFCWKSVVEDLHGGLSVPAITTSYDKVVVVRYCLSQKMYNGNPALVFTDTD